MSSHSDVCRASKIGLSKEQQVEQGLASGGYEVGGAQSGYMGFLTLTLDVFLKNSPCLKTHAAWFVWAGWSEGK
jgi:hypothetical protein